MGLGSELNPMSSFPFLPRAWNTRNSAAQAGDGELGTSLVIPGCSGLGGGQGEGGVKGEKGRECM